MSITRSQIARELMAEGGAPRQGYFFGKLVRKVKDDLIPNELKSPAGAAAAAYGLYSLGGGKYGIPGVGTDKGGFEFGKIIPRIGELGSAAAEKVGNVLGTEIGSSNEENKKKTIGSTLLSSILSPEALSIGAGLLAGAFAKDKEDPLYTGQSVGLNLRDIRKLANISDPRTGAAIGLNFLPETRFRQFTPEQMAETYATTTPVEFTEQRESADKGGIMGTQKDFNEFLKEMKKRDYGRMREQILRDYEEFMKRKKMINQMPEVKDGGIMKEFKMASAPDPAAERNSFLEMMSEKYYKKPLKDLTPDEFMDLEEALDDMGMKPRDNNMKMAGYGYNEAMSDTYDSYLDMKKNGLIPPTMTFDEFLQEVVPEMSKKEDTSGMMASAVLGGEEDDIAQELFGKPYKELTPDEIREFQEEMDRLQKKFMKRDFKKNRTMAAGGGLMNLGGMEMDLRGGGFVPIGAKERADDVPARLSKNEFVFTADAVRAAGGGSVDKGADKMYATMKALENKVA